MLDLANYVGGELVPPIDGEYLDNIDPATGEVYSLIPDSGGDDVQRAVDAAADAFPAWSRTPAVERSRMLLAIADLIEDNLEELALAECVDTGKPLALARTVDIPRAIANFRFFATAILHTSSESHTTDGVALNYTLRKPFGVAGLISPWNLPLYLLSWKIAPAIASGNTAVAKPSEITPMTAFRLSELCVDAGLPPGVLNIVHGTGPKAGTAIVDHPGIKAISFTGSTVTGAEIARRAAPRFVKLSLEMGGKNPNIVFADADLDEVLATGIRSSFSNQGQICLCGSRILVEAPVYEEFLERFVAETRQLKVGDPLEPDSDQGAIVSRAQLDKVRHYVELAREEGGSILTGGVEPSVMPERCRGGYFFQPTVIAGLDTGCQVNQEEIFGPVVTVIPFSGEAQAVEYANSTEYGLAASIWTRDLGRAHRVAEQVESGIIWVNCWMLRDLRTPFGGMKNSGVGREGGDEALRFFTEPKNVCVRISDSTTGS